MKQNLRGSTFEELINLTNKAYKIDNIALVQKIPTPITPLKINKQKITLAYFAEKSTVDYIGVYNGRAICFDAKQTNLNNFPLKNVHQHQVDFMSSFTAQGGIAFFLINFKSLDKTYLLTLEHFIIFWNEACNNGRKSIPLAYFEDKYLVSEKNNYFVDYLKTLYGNTFQ